MSRVVSPEVVARNDNANTSQLSPLQRHSRGTRDDPHADIDLDAEWEMEEVEVTEDGEEKRGPRQSPVLPTRLHDQVFNDPRSRQHHTEQSQRHITFSDDTAGGSLPAPAPGAAPPAVGRMPPRPVDALKRSLTKHVITRWYRAPEVILCQPCTCSCPILFVVLPFVVSSVILHPLTDFLVESMWYCYYASSILIVLFDCRRYNGCRCVVGRMHLRRVAEHDARERQLLRQAQAFVSRRELRRAKCR